MDNFIKDRYSEQVYKVLTGEESAPEPDLVCFYNARKANNMVYEHIQKKSKVAIHGDVDFDGVGSTYIAYTFLCEMGLRGNIGTCINKDKVHGVNDEHVNFFNSSGVDLVIILDSSTNDIEYIKKMNCDVLVVDHHEILHNELSGETVGGKYVIVNNNIDNRDIGYGEYKADSRMSGALVLYELIRIYQHMFKTPDILKSKMLYQWVGITLFTDAVSTSNLRNLYYIESTVHNIETESGLRKMKDTLNEWQKSLDKSFINYTLAPTFNRAIRAGHSGLALRCAIHNPEKIGELDKFKEIQDKAVENYMSNVLEYSDYNIKDITGTGIHKNYTGLLASKILGHTGKTTVVYTLDGDKAEGSFRGKNSSIDYRKFFDDWHSDVFAQGHKSAFGFGANVEMLPQLLNGATLMEEQYNEKEYVTAGVMSQEYRGTHHIDDIGEFKKAGLLWRLAMANSKLSTEEAISIVVNNVGYKPIETRGKVYFYDILGLECLAFELMEAPQLEIYIEFTDVVKIYVRNKWR